MAAKALADIDRRVAAEGGFNVLVSAIVLAVSWGLGHLDATSAFLLAWAVFASLGLVAIIRRHPVRQLQAIGIDRLGSRPLDRVGTAVSGAHESLDFWSVTAGSTSKDLATTKVFENIARRKGKARFLLLDPNCTEYAKRAAFEREDVATWRHDSEGAVRRLRSAADRHGADLEIRYWRGPPIWRYVNVDDREIRLQWFPANSRGNESPELLVVQSDRGLFWALKDQFEAQWSEASQHGTPQ